MSQKTVLITDYVHPHLISGLEQMSYKVIYDKDFKPSMLAEILPELTGIVINTKTVMGKERIQAGKRLEFICRLGSGLEIIDLEEAKKNDVAVFNSPEGNRNAVSEHALGMLLALSNKLIKGDREVRSRTWNRESNRGFEIKGKTIGIVGFGNTGEAFARKLSGWAQTVVYYDKYRLDICEDLDYIEAVSLKKLQEVSDIISFHLPLTNETRWLVDSNFLEQCKNGVILINTSRGAVINTKHLLDGLDSGKIGGACLDVFENEKPYTFSQEENQLYTRLYNYDCTILSPHVAGWTSESLFRISDVLLCKLRDYYSK